MNTLLDLTCPYCGKSNAATTKNSGFFKTKCVSCTVEMGIEVILPDYSATFKVSRISEEEINRFYQDYKF